MTTATTPRVFHLPPGFLDRWMSGPCNYPCGHLECQQMRAELREWGMKRARRMVNHERRKLLVRK